MLQVMVGPSCTVDIGDVVDLNLTNLVGVDGNPATPLLGKGIVLSASYSVVDDSRQLGVFVLPNSLFGSVRNQWSAAAKVTQGASPDLLVAATDEFVDSGSERAFATDIEAFLAASDFTEAAGVWTSTRPLVVAIYGTQHEFLYERTVLSITGSTVLLDAPTVLPGSFGYMLIAAQSEQDTNNAEVLDYAVMDSPSPLTYNWN
jgi:hypothetical protein